MGVKTTNGAGAQIDLIEGIFWEISPGHGGYGGHRQEK